MLFSDQRVKVDTTTFNPARIVKLYGTPARKGDSTEDRPHRLARLLEVPNEREHVPIGRLEEIAAFIEGKGESPTHQANGSGFDARGRLARWGLEVLREESYGDGTRLVLRACPFSEHRKEGKAAVIINADGRLGFHCFSDDHVGIGWKELREKYEPGYASAHNGTSPEGDGKRGGTSTETSDAGRGWPEPLSEAAYHGPVGEFARLVEPHTEADAAALLVQFLVGFGNLCGSALFRFAGGGVAHHLNEYAVIVGDTSRARKGTSWAEVERFLESVDSGWVKERVTSGLSTGEGLIWHVRDPQETDSRGSCDEEMRNGRTE